jgi:hypothetical protein
MAVIRLFGTTSPTAVSWCSTALFQLLQGFRAFDNMAKTCWNKPRALTLNSNINGSAGWVGARIVLILASTASSECDVATREEGAEAFNLTSSIHSSHSARD